MNRTYRKTRRILNFNTGWLFHKGVLAHAVICRDYDDRKWERVTLPHTVQLEPKEWIDSPSYQGISYYRRHFTIDPAYIGKKIFIRFQGVMINAEIWLNGHHIFTHYGGYLPFTVDITEDVVFDVSNVLAIVVDTNDDDQTPPGKPQSELDFVYFGGIYRSVDLIVTDCLHITDAIHANKVADGGVFVTYPEVSNEKAVVRIQTNVKNDHPKMKKVSIKTKLINERDQTIVASDESKLQSLKAGSDNTFIQKLTVNEPELWSMEDPNLYRLMIKVVVGGKEVDDYQTRIGIRKVNFTSDNGFFINDKNVLLNGVNFHEDYLYVGNAVSDSMFYRDVKKIKAAGFNFIRTGHYPHNEAFMDACNELGIAVIVPTPGWQYYTDKGDFSARSIQMTREMIRLYRNDPSVVIWEPILNETWYPERFAREAYEAVHEEYPTNQAYAASDFGAPYGKHFDVVYKEAYSETKPLLTREWGDANHYLYDGERSARKYGETSLVRSSYHRQNSLKGNKWKNKKDEDGYWDWAGLNANRRISGYALWSYNDYNRGSSQEIAHTGIVDRDRYPKFNYYWFQSQRDPYENNGPMIFIANYWTESSPKDIHVYTNTEVVKLYINDKHIDTRKPSHVEHISHPIVVFPETIWEPGQLRVEGMINDEVVVSDTVTTPEEPDQLIVAFDTDDFDYMVANGSDMIMAHVSIRDKYGHLVTTASHSISLHLSGPGILIGNGDERVQANPIRAEAGVAPALIKSTLNHGDVMLTATAPGLKCGRAVIKSVPYNGEYVLGHDKQENWLLNNEKLLQHKWVKVSSEQIDDKDKHINGGHPEIHWQPHTIDKQPWNVIDMGESCNIIGLALNWMSYKYPKGYNIQVKNNDEKWVRVIDRFDRVTHDKIQYVHFASNARYLRMQLANPYEGMLGIQVFGTKQIAKNMIQTEHKTNIALDKKVQASSFSIRNEPCWATNLDRSTMWQADTHHLPQWLQIDLGKNHFITGAKILWGKDSTHYTFKIQVSQNGHDWIDAVDKTTTGSYYQPIEFPAAQFGRYVRIWIYNILAGGGAEKVAIKSVDIYNE